MPLYEYECDGGHRFEEFHSMDDRNNAICPECGSKVKLKFSLSSFRMAVPVTVVSPEHGIVHQRPDGGQIRRYDDIPREMKDG